MPITIHFDTFVTQTEETLTQRVQFVYSPLNELFRSLHILLNPRHHGLHMPWIAASQSKMTQALYTDLQYFRLIYELGTPPLFLPSLTRFVSDLDNEIGLLKVQLTALPPTAVVETLTDIATHRENAFIPQAARGLEWNTFNPSSPTALLDDLLADATSVYQRFFDFIAHYREEIFDAYWEEKGGQTLILSEIEHSSQLLQAQGFAPFINQLQIERIKFSDKRIIIFKPFDSHIHLAATGALLFAPSLFSWPHLFVDRCEQGVFITYDLLNPRRQSPQADELAQLFFALSDTTRLALLIHLRKEKSTTQALAQLLSTTPSNVSKQLRYLKETGLVTSERQGKYVFYRTSGLLERLLPGFEGVLGNRKQFGR